MVEISLADLAGKPDWKSMLTNLVEQEQMDPWNVDVSKLVRVFLDSIKEMRKLNLRVPANAILAASVLLRFKSDSWSLEKEEVLPVFIPDVPYYAPEIPHLAPMMRTTARKVSVDELISAVGDIIVKEEKKAQRRKLRAEKMIPMELLALVDFNGEHFEKKMTQVYRRIKNRADVQNLALFSQLLDKGCTTADVIDNLVPILHLANQQRINIWQEDVFGEIFIKLVTENGRPNATA